MCRLPRANNDCNKKDNGDKHENEGLTAHKLEVRQTCMRSMKKSWLDKLSWRMGEMMSSHLLFNQLNYG